jgi:hypothetical protein
MLYILYIRYTVCKLAGGRVSFMFLVGERGQ